jgi:hypothetical protein
MESGTLKRIVPTDAAALGVIRAAFCGFVLTQMLLTDFVAFGHLPTTVMRPTGAMQLVSWRFYDALITPRGMLILKVLLVVSLLSASLGLFTAITTKSAALLFLFYEGLVRSFGLFNHDEMIGVYILVVLAFTRCGDGFSFDKRLGLTTPRLPGFAYGYPILLMRILVAWSYFTSAVIKMRVTGLQYFSADNLPVVSIWHSLDNLHESQHKLAFWLPNIRGITGAIVVVALLWELAFPLAIFSKVARRIILPFGIVFHVSTIFFMNISFPYHMAAYLVFIDWPRVASRIARSKIFQALRPSQTRSVPA